MYSLKISVSIDIQYLAIQVFQVSGIMLNAPRPTDLSIATGIVDDGRKNMVFVQNNAILTQCKNIYS